MQKEKLLFGIGGLFIGAIIGFMLANSLNRYNVQYQPAAGQTAGTNSNMALPPDHPAIGTGTGGSNPGGGAVPEVAAAIEKARQNPQDYEAQMTAADLYYQIQRFPDAAKFYEAANKIKPEDPEPIIKLGNALFDAEQYEQAEKWYVKALQKRPKDTNVRTDLGLTFFLREPRDLDRAIKEYQGSLAIDPNHEMTLQNLAVAYREKGDKENEAKTVEKLKSVNPNNPAINQTAGENPGQSD
jgi:tetratricopeptide (TPR) repeat protein